MAPATLTAPTYPSGEHFSEDPWDLDVLAYANSNSSTGLTITEFVDELAEFPSEARSSILRGLRQTHTRSRGSFAEYAKD